MRFTMFLAAGVVATAVAACSRGVQVRTAVEPNANLSGLHTFYVLAAPQRRADAPSLPADDPMLSNSITNQSLRQDLTTGFEGRGYVPAARDNADFLVAYYAGNKEKFDTTYWGPAFDAGWGYRYWGRRYSAWPYYAAGPIPEYAQVQTYTQGQLIVDVIDTRTNQLLWRGQGVATVSDTPSKYSGELGKAVSAVLKKFPQTSPTTAATERD
jgi:hypothetical protein